MAEYTDPTSTNEVTTTMSVWISLIVVEEPHGGKD